MIVGLDSAYAPTVAQAQNARTGGVRLWSGYLATRPNVGLYHPWSQNDFEHARFCGATPIAFCSGWDDPVACKALAAQWNVRLCLDVESGIRADGGWVQAWLDASGAGLYGVAAVHNGRRAAFHVLAWYTANAGATWAGQRPAAPCGWQFENSHQAFGSTVDRGYYDDWFLGSTTADAAVEVRVQEVDLTPDESVKLDQLWRATFGIVNPGDPASAPHGIPAQLKAELDAIKAEIEALKAVQAPLSYEGTVSLKPA